MHARRRLARTVAGTALTSAALVLAGVFAPPAGAAGPTTVLDGLVGPLHLTFDKEQMYVSDAFRGQVVGYQLQTGQRTVRAEGIGFVPAVDVGPKNRTYAVRTLTASPGTRPPTELVRLTPTGPVVVADLLAYEKAANPDRQPKTQDDALSNPYDLLVLDDGRVLVADAAANAIFAVTPGGRVSTLTVLPVSREGDCADVVNNGVPDGGCDPVPTALALGGDGFLYVSGLGGEVEGHVWKIDLTSGAIVQTWDGLPPLTGIAVGDKLGSVYASSLFADTVIRIGADGARKAVEVPGPTGMAIHDGELYVASASLGGPPAGKVLKYRLSTFW